MARPSTVEPKRPVGETNLSMRLSHKWCSSTIRLAIDHTMAWAVVLVVPKARSVALCRSQKAADQVLTSTA